jgi:hypothetical protein
MLLFGTEETVVAKGSPEVKSHLKYSDKSSPTA